MPTTHFRILFAASLNVALAAQAPAHSQVPQTELASVLAGGGSALPTDDGWRTLRNLPRDLQSQEPGTDYSLNALFQQDHGDFMLKRDRFDPQIELRGGSMFSGEVGDEVGDFDLLRGSADLDFRLLVSPDAYISLGAFYDTRVYNTKAMPNFQDETLTATGLNLGFGWFVAEDVLLEAKAKPGYWSDLDTTLKSEDVDTWASVLGTVRYSQEFFFKLGARYNEIYEDANILPYLGVTWASETVRVDILLPESLEISLWPSQDFAFLFGAEVTGGEYHVRSSPATGRQEGDARVQEVLAYTGIHWQFSDDFAMEARGGAVVAGDYKLEDGNPSTPVVDGTLGQAFFFDVSIGILF